MQKENPMRRINFMLLAAVAFGLGWVATTSVQAEGFAEKLPAVGTSVTYPSPGD